MKVQDLSLYLVWSVAGNEATILVCLHGSYNHCFIGLQIVLKMKYLEEALKRQSTVWLPIFSCWYSIVFSSLMCVLVGFEWRGVVQAAGISCCEPGRGEGNTTQDGLRSHYSLWWEVCGGLVEQYAWGSSSHVLVTQCSRWGLVSAKPVPHSGSGWPCITSREMCFIDCSWTLLSWLFSFFLFSGFPSPMPWTSSHAG